MREAAIEASDRIRSSAAGIAEQQDRFAALLATLDDGVGDCGATGLTTLAAAIAEAQTEATQPQPRDRPGAGRRPGPGQGSRGPCRRARPRSDRQRSSRRAPASCPKRRAKRFETVIRDERRAAAASRSSRSPHGRSRRPARRSDRLTAADADPRPERVRARSSISSRPAPSSARRTARLSPAASRCSSIRCTRPRSTSARSCPTKSTTRRGIPTSRAIAACSRAARCACSAARETRAIRAHYETDREFQQAGQPLCPRLRGDASPGARRRDGGMIAVTLMSSDMGKLYAALAQVVDKRR